MKYPQHIFQEMPERRQLEIVRRFLDRLEERLGTVQQSELAAEVEAYLAWLHTPLGTPKTWSLKAIDGFQSKIDFLLGQTVRDDQLCARLAGDQLRAPVQNGQLRVVKGDRLLDEAIRLPLKVVLHDVRSAFNVGAIFRTAECLSVEEVILSGYTPSPVHPAVKKTVMGALPHVRWASVASLPDFIADEKAAGRRVFALETVENAPTVFEQKYEWPMTVILGNERFGIDREILGLCTDVVRIPVFGVKNSLNVSNAFAVCAYEVYRKWQAANAN
jgi:tRNA G18 (ribose-2'-O)-methylase SpoU